MIPTQLKTSSGLVEKAGLMGDVLRAVQRCSVRYDENENININSESVHNNAKSKDVARSGQRKTRQVTRKCM